MKTSKYILSFLAFVVVSFANIANAYDAPYGADGIFHQQRSSRAIAFVKYLSSDLKHHQFTVVKMLKGKLPATIKVAVDNNEDAPTPLLKKENTYLAFLNGTTFSARTGIYSFPVGGYSVKPVSERSIAQVEEVVLDYINFSNDRKALAEKLLRHADSANPYIQYSAVRDLTTFTPSNRAVAEALAQKLKAGTIKVADVKADVVEQIVKFKLTNFSPVLESLVLNTNETVSVRGSSFVALERLGDTAAVRRVAPATVNDQSGRLRRIGIEVIKPR